MEIIDNWLPLCYYTRVLDSCWISVAPPVNQRQPEWGRDPDDEDVEEDDYSEESYP